MFLQQNISLIWYKKYILKEPSQNCVTFNMQSLNKYINIIVINRCKWSNENNKFKLSLFVGTQFMLIYCYLSLRIDNLHGQNKFVKIAMFEMQRDFTLSYIHCWLGSILVTNR